MSDRPIKVFVGIPSYNGEVRWNLTKILTFASEKGYLSKTNCQCSSAINCNFNSLYAQALNHRGAGITHFLLLHADIDIQEKNWVDKMVDLSIQHKADVLSAVSPIKSAEGLTSTALDEMIGSADRPHIRRLTMTEIMKRPPTWTEDKLLINTGCMLVDITKSWAEDVFFEFEDKLLKDKDGNFYAHFFPEDWNFSRKVRAAGGSIFATREVKLHHIGNSSYPNYTEWGTLKEDR